MQRDDHLRHEREVVIDRNGVGVSAKHESTIPVELSSGNKVVANTINNKMSTSSQLGFQGGHKLLAEEISGREDRQCHLN